MKKTTNVILSSMLLALLVACSGDGGFKKTKSGLLYKIVSNGKGPTVKKGEFIKVHVWQKVSNDKRDSLLETTETSSPAYIPVDSVPPFHPLEILPLLRKGDSAIVILRGDSLFSKQNGQLPPFIKKTDNIKIIFKVLDVFPTEAARNADQQKTEDSLRQAYAKKSEGQLKADISTIEAYLTKKNIKAEKTANGAYYKIDAEGTGPQCDSGKIVSVFYRGFTLDEKEFQNNFDKNGPSGGQPFQFQSGVSGAIPGMLEAIQKFKKGGKGYMYIPSPLAYGANPDPRSPFKPNEILAFYIEVADVLDAPKMPQPPQQP
jgi:FKBP-type peptidyl-prolyl cis-trans isomerase